MQSDDESDDEARREAYFDRGARLDRWVQARGAELQRAYEEQGDGRVMLSLAASAWVRDAPSALASTEARGPSRAADLDHAVAAIAAAVAASVPTNLEPACARLVWAARSAARSAEALEAAEHYAALGLAAARRRGEREAAECVWEAIRFVSAPASEPDVRDDALARFAELAQRRLVNLGALVGAYLPFWSFPYAFRWERAAPPFGRGARGVSDPVDDRRIEGWLALAYRMGKGRDSIAAALDRCAWQARRHATLDALEHARSTLAIAELAEDLSRRWAITGASSPLDAVERIAARALVGPFAIGERDLRRAAERAQRALCPVLGAEWPDVAEVGREHAAWRRERAPLATAA